MSPLENIVNAIHALGSDEKVKLRVLLDAELRSTTPSADGGAERAKRIIGLFADEPDLMDRVMESVYESRSRPLRLDSR
jgi:hypothetical protein